jgi:C-terminal processing protease CtpA/Prc
MMEQMFSLFGLNLSLTDEGLQVDAIDEGSPFAGTDLQQGDVITAINGEAVGGMGFMGSLMGTLGSGEPLSVTVLRDGEELTLELEVDLGNVQIMPMQPGGQGQGMGPMMGQGPTQLGIRYRVLTTAVAEEEGMTLQQGALVVTVYEDTPASDAGLQEGDVIVAVDGDDVDEEHTLSDRLYAYEEGDVVTLSVVRGDAQQELEVTLGPRNVGQGFGGGGMMGPGMGWWSEADPEFFENHPWMMPGPHGEGMWQWFGPEGGEELVPEAEPEVPQTAA